MTAQKTAAKETNRDVAPLNININGCNKACEIKLKPTLSFELSVLSSYALMRFSFYTY